ncbi:MAG: hypothetical protein ACOYNS_09595 [Bacteroidota bacterium]
MRASFLIVASFAVICLQSTSAQMQYPSDTLRLSVPCMVFYSPARTESESLMARSVFSYDSLNRNFIMLRERIEPFLNKKSIASVPSSARYFVSERNDSLLLDRRAEQEHFGVIFFSRKKDPLIQRGLHTDSEVFTAMMRYFDIRR